MANASINKKLVVVPEEAETVRQIFRRYLELGSIRELAEDLDHKGIRTRRQTLSTGKTRGGIRFGVGALAHLLRNRFYIGEVVYEGAVHLGEQEPILDCTLFEAVRSKLAASANTRQLKLKASPAILTGRIFDDRGNRMTPTHTNKHGARYRYYVSHATLQKRDAEGGSVVRVSAPGLEAMVTDAVRGQFDEPKSAERPPPMPDRTLIEQYVERIIVKPQTIEIHFFSSELGTGSNKNDREIARKHHTKTDSPGIITVPWTTTVTAAAKGALHSPSPRPSLSEHERDVLLTAVAKARVWIDDIVEGRAGSFADIAKREGKVERHVRFLAPLAFLSPLIMSDIIDRLTPPIRVRPREALTL